MSDVIDYFGTGRDGGGNSFLSNFFEYDDTTLEHQYQAAKTDDPEWKARILAAATPKEAKRLGRQAPMRPTWDDEKLFAMEQLLHTKFAPHSQLARMLLHTGDAVLIEGNWWGDIFWGVCDGQGQNWLGVLLMKVRDDLRKELAKGLANSAEITGSLG